MNKIIKITQFLLKPFLWTWIWKYQPFKSIYKLLNFTINTFKPNILKVNTIYWFDLIIDTRKIKTWLDTIVLWWYYERLESDIIKKISEWKKDFTFIDIWANIWYYSILVATHMTSWKVFSYEPLNMTYELLKQNIKLNNQTNIVKTIKKWIWNVNSKIDIYFNEEDLLLTSTNNNNFYKHKNKETIEIVKLDSQIDIFNNIDLIKIDIEWEELNAFKWMTNIFKLHKPLIIFEFAYKLYNEEEKKDIFQIFLDNNYKIFEINESKQKLIQYYEMNIKLLYSKYTNFICIHNDKTNEYQSLIKELS